jgi:hypothetical protein
VVGVVPQVGRDAARGGGREGSVHGGEDGGGGPEGIEQLALRERVERAQAVLEMEAHAVEGLGVGALEGVDRLLLVAHDEQRALPVRACAFAGGELAARCSITSHWPGLVSCASSTRMWSIPPSSR